MGSAAATASRARRDVGWCGLSFCTEEAPGWLTMIGIVGNGRRTQKCLEITRLILMVPNAGESKPRAGGGRKSMRDG